MQLAPSISSSTDKNLVKPAQKADDKHMQSIALIKKFSCIAHQSSQFKNSDEIVTHIQVLRGYND